MTLSLRQTAKMVNWELHYDRRVSDVFLQHFLPGGSAHRLVEYARFAAYPLDLQMRYNPKTGTEHASLYVGLTTVLDVHRHKGGLLLKANAAYRKPELRWQPSWDGPLSVKATDSEWRQVEDYLERVIPHASTNYAGKEGPVQAAASVFHSRDRVMVDREVALHFRDKLSKQKVFDEITAPFLAAVKNVDGVPGSPPSNFGGECDLLALDAAGRLLAVEIKPAGVSTIVWATAQATVYAKLLERWVQAPPSGTDRPVTILRGMLEQRARLGLAPLGRPAIPEKPVVVPVVGIQRGETSAPLIKRMKQVQKALVDAGCGNEDLEVYEVNLAGRLDRVF